MIASAISSQIGRPDDRDDHAHREVESALDEPVGADEHGRAQLEERDALPGDVLASPLDEELGRRRRDPHLDPAPVRLLDDLHELAVVEIGVGDDQLVDVVLS